MKEKNISSTDIILKEEEILDISKEYDTLINTDPKYSLEIDPENKYGLSDEEKKFIKNYIDYKNISTAALLSGIPIDIANNYYNSYACQQEVKRVNAALCQRRFHTKMVTLDQIGSYLSSMLTGENTPFVEQAHTAEDKLKVIKTILDLNKFRNDLYTNANEKVNEDLEKELKSLSIESLKILIETSNEKEEKEKLMKTINKSLQPEELAYLKTLSAKDLLNFIKQINGDKNNEQ